MNEQISLQKIIIPGGEVGQECFIHLEEGSRTRAGKMEANGRTKTACTSQQDWSHSEEHTVLLPISHSIIFLKHKTQYPSETKISIRQNHNTEFKLHHQVIDGSTSL